MALGIFGVGDGRPDAGTGRTMGRGPDHPHALPGETRIVNAVLAQEGFEAFARETLGPALQQLEGVTPEMMFFPVYRLIEG
jgi:hypothetical protein